MAPPSSGAPANFWRVFPWDPSAPEGAPFSRSYVVPAERQGGGRFDLGTSSVLYLAESPEHAIAEVLRPFAGTTLHPDQLIYLDHPLAAVQVSLDSGLSGHLADLNDPAVLLQHGIRPDRLASRDRAVTQAVSRKLYFAGLPGFRWWSALHGDWHVALLFMDRIGPGQLSYGAPEALVTDHPAVQEAARVLRLRTRSS